MTLPHIVQRKHSFFVKIKEKSKSQKQIPKMKVFLGLLQQRLGNMFTRSLSAGDTSVDLTKKHKFLVKTKEKSKSQKQIPKKKVSLGLLHHILGHMSKRSPLVRDTANFRQDIYIRVYSDRFCRSCHISTINK